MTSTTFPYLILFLCLRVSLMSPACSLTYLSESLPNIQKMFANSINLSTLNAIHTYDASNSSLSTAFEATPASPKGWIAWAINPTRTGIVGVRALIALKSDSSLLAKMFNISSCSLIMETNKLAFEGWDLAAESDVSGKNVIYTSVKAPAAVRKLNMVWQVGTNIANGIPLKYAFAKENLDSKGELQL